MSSLNKILSQLVFYLINAVSIIKLKVFLNLFSCLFMPVINVAFTSLYLLMQLKKISDSVAYLDFYGFKPHKEG